MMLKRLIFKNLTILSFTGASLCYSPLLQAQPFQNFNQSCQEVIVVGQNELAPFDIFNPHASHSITCGQFNEDNFLDCVTQRHPLPISNSGDPVPSNSFILNTGNTQNNCPNLNVGDVGLFSENSDLLSNTGFNYQEDAPSRMGTIARANLDDQNFDDIAWVRRDALNPMVQNSGLQFLFSEIAGGFSSDFNPGNALINIQGNIFAFSSYFAGPSKRVAERSLVTLNCDEDSVDEAVVSVQTTAFDVGILLSQNSGTGLTDMEMDALTLLPVTINEAARVSLSSADFNQDGILDIIAAVDTLGDVEDAVVFCTGEENCGFNCPESMEDERVFNLSLACGQQDCTTGPSSVTAGDFNGDGLQDIAIAEARASQIRYLFNNNENGADGHIANWETATRTYTGPDFQILPLVLVSGRFSQNAFENQIDELVFSANTFNPDINANEEDSFLGAILTEGKAINSDYTLLQFFPENPRAASSLYSGDLDHCGGDDIIALAQNEVDDNVVRFASIFLNENEAPTIEIETDLSGITDTSISITAQCDDPTLDNRNFTWSVLSSPQGATVNLVPEQGELTGNNTDASTQFTADIEGEYVLQLSCSDSCETVLAQTSINLTNQGSGEDTGETTGTEEVLLTQGGCISSLSGASSPHFAWVSLLGIFALLIRRIHS
ncbi:MAG: FG-GAP repeat protein [Deltaproteobacteria bacterium]|nr:FG-GAP repeat protein [Deltaproteobacteria bacterium]